MTKGKVKWFNNAKGYGFIISDDGGDDLFVHHTYIDMNGYRTLKAGQNVEFEVQEAPKGVHAINLKVLDGGEEAPSQEESATGAETNNNEALELNPESTS